MVSRGADPFLRAGGVPEHFNLPWRLAIEEGRVARSGLSVDWRDYSTGTGAMLADLAARNLDLAVLLTEGAALGLARGLPIAPLGLYTSSPLIWGVHVAGDSKLAAVAALGGARFAISRHGSGSHLMSLALGLRQGWAVADMRFEVVGDLPGAIEAFRRGGADVFLWEHFTTEPEVEAGVFRRVDDFVAPWPAWVICANQDSLDENRAAMEALIEIVAERAARLARADDAAELIAARYGLRETAIAEWLAKTRWTEGLTAADDALTRARRMLETAGAI